MKHPEQEIPTLDYDAPRVLFVGEYRYRSLQGMIGAGVGVVLAVVACMFVVFVDATANVERIVRGMLVTCALACAIGVLYNAWAWWTGYVIRVEINEDGVLRGRMFWGWEQIRCLGGRGDAFGVTPFIELKGYPITKNLLMTPPLTENQYHGIAEKPFEYLKSSFPEVKVKREILRKD